ncbi:MAG: hypothetical protein H0W70_06625, partial [Actinobacteria bacterium]|nr:hypothetical protein [Actinomycetota bacterium]
MNPTKAVLLRRGRLLGAVVVMAMMAVQLLAPAARADTVSQKRAQATHLADEIQRAEERIGVAAERVNNARLKTDAVRAGVADAEAKMQAADRRAGQVKTELRAHAV